MVQDLQSKTDSIGRVRKVHCKHGHKFPENARWTTNWKGYSCRVCPECDRLRMQRKRADPNYRKKARDRQKQHRQRRGPEYLAHVRGIRKASKLWLDTLKSPCNLCGESHVACLDFHHRDPREKRFLISRSYFRYKKETVLLEVAKCDVICANCHRKLHYDERQKI